jgi:ketosteroid isomerase-like protein
MSLNHPLVPTATPSLPFFKSFPLLSVFKTEDVETEGNGDIGYIHGTHVITIHLPNAVALTAKGRCIEACRKRFGAWRCAVDIYNADVPAN